MSGKRKIGTLRGGRAGTAGRAFRRRLALGLPTVLGVKPKGYFIPYRYRAALPNPGDLPSYPALEDVLEAKRSDFAAALDRLGAYSGELLAIGTAAPAKPRWGQSWFPRLDAAMAYLFMRERQPKRVLEVGSGHSTRFLAAARRDGGFACRITAIDPAPRADLTDLDVDLRRCLLHQSDPDLFRALEAGDFLIVDSSHIAMPGSDVDQLTNRILPELRPGVVVMIHDIFLPDDYPQDWAWRGYNEQLLVAPLLLYGAWEVLFASHFAASRMAAEVASSLAGRLPLPKGAVETALWLRRR